MLVAEEVQAPEFVRGEPRALLVEIAGIAPRGHGRIRALLGRRVDEAGVGREIGGMPHKDTKSILGSFPAWPIVIRS